MTARTRRTLVRTVALAGALSLGLAACSGGGDSGSGSDDASGGSSGSLTIWAWEPALTDVVADFQEDHPDVDIELVNAGTGNDQYTALQNAIAAGSGVPDVAQIEYYAVPQFAIGESLTDLTEFGADELDGTFSPGPWNAVHQGEGIYNLPMDSGPMALFYNAAVFERLGVEVPTTWEEYLQAARDLHAADPSVYIASDTGDAGSATSMIWQAGGHPFQVDGTDVTIDFTDEGTQKYTDLWQQMIDEGLLSDISGWTDEWYQGLGNGTLATLVVGAWMPANLESGVAQASGDWRVAEMPQWEAGDSVTAENGGSGLSIPAGTQNAELAYEFLQYATAGDGVQTRIDAGAFPATVADLESEEFLGKEFEYFGGQKANEILAKSAADVAEGWQYLPFQVYANSIFNDTAGQAYVSDTTLQDGLLDWQDKAIAYGNEQGFSVD